VKAVCWEGVDEVGLATVPDPRLINGQDAIVRVTRTSTCGSDLHLIDGNLPFLQAGDVLGHEFVGEIVEVGPRVRRHRAGERVVVCSFVACGRCWYCEQGLFSCCDNGNTNPAVTETAWGFAPSGCYGYSGAAGGFGGSHAEYVRVPYVDYGAFTVPDGVSDDRAIFASDSAPAGWMGAELGGVKPGDVVAVWGCGAVGQLAAQAAMLLGAERVVAIDRYGYRLEHAARHTGADTINYEQVDVDDALLEYSGGRGPDVCIEAVGMAAEPTADAVREAVYNCRKGGTVFILGVFAGIVDGFPLGAVMNKGLTVRAAQQHGQRYIPMLLARMAKDELVTEHLATHVMPLQEAAQGYRMFKERTDGCVRAVFVPGPDAGEQVAARAGDPRAVEAASP
jgi:threonine dehydrogenase-like Zn-dependent dehydrogenase